MFDRAVVKVTLLGLKAQTGWRDGGVHTSNILKGSLLNKGPLQGWPTHTSEFTTLACLLQEGPHAQSDSFPDFACIHACTLFTRSFALRGANKNIFLSRLLLLEGSSRDALYSGIVCHDSG